MIRHDNRDIGRSTHLDGAQTPSLWQLLTRSTDSAYTLAEMAGDSVGVLDALGIEQAHIVGASMGGMIAQTVAIRYPRAHALAGLDHVQHRRAFWSGQPALSLYAVLLKPAPRDREAFIEHAVDMFTKIGGSGYEPDVEDLRTIATHVLRPRARPARLAAPARGDRRRPRPLARARAR